METTYIGEYQNEILLKAIDVANILNISRSMAYKLMQDGNLPTVHIGNAKRVRYKDLLQFIQTNLKQKLPHNVSG